MAPNSILKGKSQLPLTWKHKQIFPFVERNFSDTRQQKINEKNPTCSFFWTSEM